MCFYGYSIHVHCKFLNLVNDIEIYKWCTKLTETQQIINSDWLIYKSKISKCISSEMKIKQQQQ